MRQSWNDDRLDELRDRVEAGFARVDRRSTRIEARLDEGFARLDAKFESLDAKVDAKIGSATAELRQEMKAGFDEVNRRFDAMQQTMIRVGGGLIGVLVAGLVATQI